MSRINIRISKKTHRRLNLLKGTIGIQLYENDTPTLDSVINSGLDALELQLMFEAGIRPTTSPDAIHA